jgi:hypothetical protein
MTRNYASCMGLCSQRHTTGCCPEHCNATQYITHLFLKTQFLWFLQNLLKFKKSENEKAWISKKRIGEACKERMIKKTSCSKTLKWLCEMGAMAGEECCLCIAPQSNLDNGKHKSAVSRPMISRTMGILLPPHWVHSNSSIIYCLHIMKRLHYIICSILTWVTHIRPLHKTANCFPNGILENRKHLCNFWNMQVCWMISNIKHQ